MKFLVDAQLPRRLVMLLRNAGHDAVHTLDLPMGNRTKDQQINDVSDREDRIVITKDADFVNSHLLYGQPGKLLIVSTGNIKNADLEALFLPNLPTIVAAFGTNCYVELSRTALVVHA